MGAALQEAASKRGVEPGSGQWGDREPWKVNAGYADKEYLLNHQGALSHLWMETPPKLTENKWSGRILQLLSCWGSLFFSFHSSHLPIYSELLLKDMCVVCVSSSIMFNSLWPQGLIRLLCPWSSPGKNTGVCCHSLLQWIFLTQGVNLGILSCRQIIYYQSQQGIYSIFSTSSSQAFTYLDSANKVLLKQHFSVSLPDFSLLPQVLTNTSVSIAMRKTSAWSQHFLGKLKTLDCSSGSLQSMHMQDTPWDRTAQTPWSWLQSHQRGDELTVNQYSFATGRKEPQSEGIQSWRGDSPLSHLG